MSQVEQQLRDALAGQARQVSPAPDLLLRTLSAVESDRRSRRRHRLVAVTAVATALAALVSSVLTGVPFLLPDVRLIEGEVMTWWVLEAATTTLLVALALWLGPFIKRFGRAYAADVFHDNPMTGKSYLVLADIVYYLIFTAYILFTVRFERASGWSHVAGADQLQYEAARLGGILLVMGVLHGLNLVLMPVLGRVFSLNRRLVAPSTLAPSQREAITSEDVPR